MLSNGNLKILYFIALGAAFWILMIVLAPVFRSFGNSLGEYIYFFYEPVCHQIPERSLTINSEPMAVCTRCFSIYSGAFITTIFILIRKNIVKINIGLIILFLLPTTFDFILEKAGIYSDVPAIRIVTGFFFGATLMYLIISSVLDVKSVLLNKQESNYGKSEIY